LFDARGSLSLTVPQLPKLFFFFDRGERDSQPTRKGGFIGDTILGGVVGLGYRDRTGDSKSLSLFASHFVSPQAVIRQSRNQIAALDVDVFFLQFLAPEDTLVPKSTTKEEKGLSNGGCYLRIRNGISFFDCLALIINDSRRW
jgi:hypothetical protein